MASASFSAQGALLAERDYWKNKLAGVTTVSSLRSDYDSNGLSVPHGSVELEFPQSVIDGLNSLTNGSPFLIYTAVMAAAKVCLHKYSGGRTIIVGSPALKDLGRTNLLAITSELDAEMTFRELLQHLRGNLRDAYQNQNYPFDYLLRDLGIENGHGYCPFFDLVISAKDLHGEVGDFDGVKLDLENSPRLSGLIEFSPIVYAPDSISAFANHLIAVLEEGLSNKDKRLDEFEMLTPGERNQLLVEWNQTQAPYPIQCVHELFEAQVNRSAQAIALHTFEEDLSYVELNKRANRLAHYLREQGVGAEVAVGICMERSWELVVSLLAVLKAGGAYVPLDPEYPLERLRYMMEEINAWVVLTQGHLAERLPAHWGQVVCVDDEWKSFDSYSEENPQTDVVVDNPAYVIYTSGSTGQPKGVVVTHKGIGNLIETVMIPALELSSSSRVLQFASFSFDASVFEIFNALLSGATLCIAPRELLLPGPNLIRLLRNERITKVTLPPSVLTALPDDELPDLRTLVVAGEACSLEIVKRWSGGRKFFDAYGPSEATVCATMGQCTDLNRKPSIGRPNSNTEIFILDQQLRPAPIGVAGELCIGGIGLARGYWSRPELTAEKFIPHPFSTTPGSRLYLTGDLARYRPDGQIDFLGRLDHQVKVRGFRIELSEIEALLKQHVAIQDAVVIVRGDRPDDKRIVAYIVAKQQPAPTVDELLDYLKLRLPEFMMPQAFVTLERMPLNLSGKIDRRMLPEPDQSRPDLKETFVAPIGETQETLARIWSEVLRVEPIGANDDFFALGGESILAIQIVARANQEGLRLQPKHLFEYQTIAELALVAGTATEIESEQGEVTGPVPLTPIQHWFFEHDASEPHHYNQSVMLEAQESLDLNVLKRATEALLAHHDALRMHFKNEGQSWCQFNGSLDQVIPVEYFDLSKLADDQLSRTIEQQASALQAGLNLVDGPLLRVTLFHCGPTRPDRLLIVVHHLVVDGVSWRILLDDLQKAYMQAHRGQPVDLGRKTTSFKHWAEQLVEYAQSSSLEAEQSYWLAGANHQSPSLPVDFANRSATFASAERVLVSLTTDETRSLLQDVPAIYNTQINDVLLTAVLRAVHAWTGERSLLISLEGHGREEIVEGVDLSQTVGWFTTEYPVFLSLPETEDEGDALCFVKEQLRAIPQHGIGYGLLRYLSADAVREQLRAGTQPELSFNYLGQFDQVLSKSSLFRAARESRGQTQAANWSLPHQLLISGSVAGGSLQLSLTYSSNVFKQATIERFGRHLNESLRTLIAHCSSPEAGRFTPSDFPLAHLTQAELDRITGKDKQVDDIYPLTPFQQGLLFHALYSPGTDVYFSQISGTIDGQDLDVASFRRAWQHVIDRHPILRTGFVWEGVDEALQVVRRQVALPWQEFDWRDLSPAEQQAQLQAFLKNDQQRGFVLSEAPLIRCTLIRLAEDNYRFTWSLHHLLLDGWAMMQVVKEIFSFYDAFAAGQELSLTVGRPFRDYIAWLQKQDQAKAETFWRKALAGFAAPSPIQVARADFDPAAKEDYFDQRFSLSVAATEALKDFARRHQLTLNTIVQGMFGLVLGRYSGADDVVFGATVSGRPPTLLGIESMVGVFINTLPVRIRISSRTTVLSWLRLLQEQQVEAQQYEYTPLVQVQSWSDVPRGHPLFETILIFENYPMDASLKQRQFGLMLKDVSSIDRANYPLAVGASPGTQLHFRFSYDRRVYEDETIMRMFGHLQTLLEAAVANPEQRLADLPLLTNAEQRQMLAAWNETANPSLPQACLHELFEAQVQLFPDASALHTPEAQLSYVELNKRANRLARFLREQGVGAEAPVGICMERSWELVVSLLAVLKAGGAYVPLDPEYPLARLQYMMEEINAWVVLTQGHLAERLPAYWGQVVCVDDEWESFDSYSEENPAIDLSGDNLASLIFTSGSTGLPKAALVTHGGICNTILHRLEALSLTHEDRFLQTNSFSFDASVWEFFAPLAIGAELVMLRPGGYQDPAYIADMLVQRRITTVEFPPSWLRMILQEPALDRCTELKHVICGGQILTGELQERFYSRLSAQLYNFYGPTEASIDATGYTCEREVITRTAPIGRPISNVQVYILDELLRPVPIGVSGELHIGGEGLARGYLNQASLTAEKFIPNPFAANEGERLYKTGDVARYLADGLIEFCGRNDDQVKIRGFRIELGEVEAVLVQHPEVLEATIVAMGDTAEDTPGDKRLVAYFVAAVDCEPTIDQLRSYMKSKLPEHMAPSAFVMLERLPRNLNGKVDREALPALDLSRPQLEAPFVAPRNSLEETLARIWIEVLGVQQVGIDDSFFALGGDSIRSVQVLSKAQQEGLSFSLQSIFQQQTIRGLAEEIRPVTTEATPQSTPFSLISEADRERLPDDAEDAYPLTMLQAGMIFHTEYHPDTAVYHSISSRRVRARLELDALRSAIQRIVEQHTVLRSSFHLHEFSEPLQVIHRKVVVPVTEEDLRHIEPAEQARFVAEWLEVEKLRHFDWTRAPMLRLHVHRFSDHTFQFTFSAHHSVLDGWSDSIVFSDLFKRYTSLLNGEPEPVAVVPAVPYREFVWLEQQALQSEETRNFWKEKLSGSVVTRLPRWTGSDEATSGQCRRISIPISDKVSDGLRNITQITGLPIKNVLLAAHLKVMTVLMGQRDVITGLVSNGRPEMTDGERMVGLFLNTLPFRVKLQRGSWIDLAERVFATEKEMLPHRRYPLAKIQRDHGGQSLFETAFNFTQFHLYQELRDFSAVEVLGSVSIAETNFTLMVDFGVGLNTNKIQASMAYNTAELREKQIAAIVGYYATTLEAMAADPHADHDKVSLLSEAERRQQLEDWNSTTTAYASDVTLAQLFEAQVDRTPDAGAVVCEDQRLSYRELNSRANQLAHHLRRRGVGAETRVAVCLNRSVEMLVAITGIWKAGGVYVPLDPLQPKSRSFFMIDDSHAQIVITQKELMHLFLEEKVTVLQLDSDRAQLEQESELNPELNVLPENLAYVIYTSGSTGQPKGAMIQQRSVANLQMALGEEIYKAGAGALRVCLNAPLAFDSSIKQLAQLFAGHTLYVIPEEVRRDGRALAAYLQEHQLDALDCTPSQLKLLSDFPPRLLVAGEALSKDLWLALAQDGSTTAYNVYGPTECTVDTTACRIDKTLDQPAIGRPLANMKTYVLDAQLRLLPVGVTGELHIGGAGLARGYLDQPALTAEKFIPNPFSVEAGARMYKTGDLARYLPDGNLVFVGRDDEQVKVRGFRVELGEIEAALSKHAAVRDVVVHAPANDQYETRLVAYVVSDIEPESAASELRRYLKDKLPAQMMPQGFVVMDQLPIGPSGKIDRRALPPWKAVVSERDEADDVTTLPIEDIVAGIWAEVLGIEQAGVNDSFFDLGGHSLLATQVISRVREAFKTEIPLRTLFETPTLASFAATVQAALSGEYGLPAPPIKPVDREMLLPLSFAQQRLWIAEQLTKGAAVYHLPSALRLRGELNVDALQRSLNEVIRRHEALRTTFTLVDGKAVQVIAPSLELPMPVVDLFALPEGERETETRRLADEFMLTRFDLSTGPLLRAQLLRLHEQDHVVLFVMHHIISDGWSMGLLVKEIATLYDAFMRERSSPLAELPVQYADFAVWQREWLQGDVLQAQLDYWRKQLGPRPPQLILPLDRPRPPVQTHHGAHMALSIDAETQHRLNALSRRAGVTMFMTLLAAFQTLLYRYSSQEDIVVGTDMANRNRAETERVIGFFVNMLVLRTDLSGNPTFLELLARVREVALGAYAHQDLPFDRLVDELEPERDPSRNALFQAVFVLQNNPSHEFKLPGITLNPVRIESNSVQFDLIFSLSESRNGIAGVLAYNTDLFNETTIAEMIARFKTLLQTIVEDPNQRIADMRLIATDGLTRADFPRADISQKDFESLLAQLSARAQS